MAAASAEPAVAATASAAPTAPTKALANPQSIPNKPPAPPTTSNVSATKNGKLNVDSSSRQNHVANARKNYGSSTPSFKSKCQALLSKLSSCENIQNEYLLATESRQEREKCLEVASTWVQVRKIETATARLKLARLRAESHPSGDTGRQQGMIKVCECDLKVKTLAQEISDIEEKQARRELEKARKLELSRLTLLTDWNGTIETVKAFPGTMAQKKRKIFYFSYCNQEGHAPWYCQALAERDNSVWKEYPGVKWFVTQKGTQLYCPVGNVKVDYSDQHVYSRCIAEMPGHEHVSYKGKLAELHLPFHPRSWHIRKCAWHGNPPPAHMDDGVTVWFLKDTLRNYSMGITICKTLKECIDKSTMENNYVVQRQIVPYLVTQGYSSCLHLRRSGAGSNICASTFWLCQHGWLALAPEPYQRMSFNKDQQISRDRDCKLSEWPEYVSLKLEAKVVALTTQLARAVRPKLSPPKDKSAFLILGLDIMIDEDYELWLLECNAGPVIREADYNPMIKNMIDLTIPRDMKPCVDVPASSGWKELDLHMENTEEEAPPLPEPSLTDNQTIYATASRLHDNLANNIYERSSSASQRGEADESESSRAAQQEKTEAV